MISRIEKDEFGQMEIPASAYYGIKTLRNKELFTITKFKIHKQMIKSLALVKKACASANYEAGYLTEQQQNAIIASCDEIYNGRFNNQFITDAIQGGSCIAFNINMDEVVANRANEILGAPLGSYKYIDPYKDVDLFQSPNDVINAAAKHSILTILNQLLVEGKKLEKELLKKAKQYSKVFKLGRDHLQDSLPISFKDIFEAMASVAHRDLENIENRANMLKFVNLGAGTLGVSYYADDVFTNKILDYFNQYTKGDFSHPKSAVDEARNLDSFLDLSQALRMAAINLSKTTSDIRLMASGPNGGFNEINLPSYEAVSGLNVINHTQSIPEIVNQVCFQIIGKDMAISLAVEHGQQEVNAFSSIIYANMFDIIEYLTRTIYVFREFCIKQLTVNEEYCKEKVANSLGIIAAFLEKLPYHTCVDVFLQAKKENKTIKEVCLERKLLSPEVIDKLINMRKLTK